MGREIRRVPEGWEHPENDDGHYKPMYDKTYDDACESWLAECIAWTEGKHPAQSTEWGDDKFYWDYAGPPPCLDDDTHRPAFEGEPTHWQMYETVTEGTPVSPVFATAEELAQWLHDEKGYDIDTARKFVESGWGPSFTIMGGVMRDAVETAALR